MPKSNYRLEGNRQNVFELDLKIEQLLDSYYPNLIRMSHIFEREYSGRVVDQKLILSKQDLTRHDEASGLFIRDARMIVAFCYGNENHVKTKREPDDAQPCNETWYANPDVSSIGQNPFSIINNRIPNEGNFSVSYTPCVHDSAILFIHLDYYVDSRLNVTVEEGIHNLIARAKGVNRMR